MNIALIGYGRMGQAIEQKALERGHTITFKIDVDNKDDFDKMNADNVDVAIEFTRPDSAVENIKKCFELNIPVVCGTTGWVDQLEELKNQSVKEQKGFLFASNFSVGVNILFSMNKKLAQIMNRYPDYSVNVEETHHTKKLDAPSGTAITIAEGILENSEPLNDWELSDTALEDKLGIKAIREGDVFGIHKIFYNSSVDVIELSHSAKSRNGFALGSVLAAEFMKGKNSYYEMKDVLKLD